MIEYVTAEDIRTIHNIALERYGGVSGEHEPGQIEFMAAKPSMVSYANELYPGLFMKAAVYMHGFATRQFFVDGNKRTAYLTAAVFLELNGYSLIVNDEDLYDMALAVANNRVTERELSEWFQEHAVLN